MALKPSIQGPNKDKIIAAIGGLAPVILVRRRNGLSICKETKARLGQKNGPSVDIGCLSVTADSVRCGAALG